MPLTREQIYNELNGSDCKQILLKRFSDRLNEIPWLQRHLTLPRVRMKLSVTFELYADQPTPESHLIEDDLTLRTEGPDSDQVSSVTIPPPGTRSPERTSQLEPTRLTPHTYNLEDVVDASPETGDPPDQIREEHNLPNMVPTRNKTVRAIEDIPETVYLSEGVSIHRPKTSPGPSPSRGATTVNQDYGPRIARSGNEAPSLKNRDRANNPAPIYVPRQD